MLGNIGLYRVISGNVRYHWDNGKENGNNHVVAFLQTGGCTCRATGSDSCWAAKLRNSGDGGLGFGFRVWGLGFRV